MGRAAQEHTWRSGGGEGSDGLVVKLQMCVCGCAHLF